MTFAHHLLPGKEEKTEIPIPVIKAESEARELLVDFLYSEPNAIPTKLNGLEALLERSGYGEESKEGMIQARSPETFVLPNMNALTAAELHDEFMFNQKVIEKLISLLQDPRNSVKD